VRLFKLVSIVFTLLVSFQVYAAIDSQVDRNVVEQGQTFLLMLNLTQNNSSQVDLSPLEKDFEIIGRSHQSSTTFINGSLESSTKLIITLAPKRAGKLTIPPLTLEGEKSQAHSIEVKPVKQLSAADGGVELLSTLSDKSPMVQQPIIYQMNLVLGQRIYNASFQEPTIKQGKALIQTLGEQRQYRETLNGRELLVIEQSWLITPQQSGTLEIDSAKLSAEVRRLNGGNTPFRSMNDPRAMRRIFISADSYKVDVAPIPENFSGKNWLAASGLSLESEVSSEGWKVGEPVTRTIKLVAKGVGQDQLTEIVLPKVSGIKQYAAKPIYEQEQKDNELSVNMTQEITIIPSQQGDVVLPEIRVAWWNTKTNQEEVAVLEKQIISVAPSGTGKATENLDQSASLQPNVALSHDGVVLNSAQTTKAQPLLKEDTPSIPMEPVQAKTSWLFIAALVIFGAALGSFITAFWYKRSKKQGGEVKTNKDHQALSLSSSLNKLHQACKTNNPQSARDALLAWGQVRFPGCTNLNSLQLKLSTEGRDLINELNRCCYNKERSNWEGEKLWCVIKNYSSADRSSKAERLAPLVPS